MKKIFLLIVSILFITQVSFAQNEKISSAAKSPFINSSKAFNTEASEIREIKKTLKNLNKYTNNKNLEGIKNVYSKDFYGDDGFDYETYIKMVEETFSAYSDIKYTTKIRSVSITGDWAIVQVSDKTTANLPNKDFDDPIGNLLGFCDYTLYLKKYNGSWKIVSDQIDYEETILKYGEAKNYKIDFEAPLVVEKGKDYDLTLQMEPPKGVFVVASLGKEEVLYPPKKPKDAFRKLPQEGILERVVRANTNNHNEYATASVGFTKLTVEDEDVMQIKFKMSGMAFIMKRVNIINEKLKNESIKKAQN